MTISTILATIALASGSPAAIDDTAPAATPDKGAVVNLAICLDTSGSMDGLIDAARRNIWSVVNDLALAEPTPQLQIALLTFGNDGHEESDGWVRIHAPLTGNLDFISQELFAQSTDGGTELVARVIDRAVTMLDWDSDPNALKIIIVAGNEGADQDTTMSYQDACRNAIAQGIMVNSIYCGNAGDAEAAAWREVSMLADGAFATIDKDKAIVHIPTPFDEELARLNEAINTTYVAYGSYGWAGQERQTAEDDNATHLGATVAASRVACKAGALYDNAGWDLVDACREKVVDLETIDEADLPENMRAMSLEERQAYIAAKQGEREALAGQVASVVNHREAFRLREQKRLAIDESQSLGSTLRRAIREQASAKGVQFPKPSEPAEQPSDATPPALEAAADSTP